MNFVNQIKYLLEFGTFLLFQIVCGFYLSKYFCLESGLQVTIIKVESHSCSQGGVLLHLLELLDIVPDDVVILATMELGS